LLWTAAPTGAGDPLGQITEFTTGLTPDSAPVGITAAPDGNLRFTEASPPRRIDKIGAGCVPPPTPRPTPAIPLTTEPRFTG
jgi:hypothetical protein